MTAIDERSFELFGSIVSANVTSLAAVNERIREHDEAQTRSYAKAFVDLFDALEHLPDMLRTVYIDNLLSASAWQATRARELLAKEES